MAIYAQINSGVVVNTILLDNASLIPLFSAGFDYFIDIDSIIPAVGIGWFYDAMSNTFTPPLPVAPKDTNIDNYLIVQKQLEVTYLTNADAIADGVPIGAFWTQTGTLQVFQASEE